MYICIGNNNYTLLQECGVFASLMMSFPAFHLIEMDAREIVEPPAKKRKQYAGHYEDDWKCVFNGVITPSKLDDHHSWCVVCSCDVNVSPSGVYDVRMHLKSKIHEKNVKSALHHAPLTSRAVDRFFQAQDPDAGFDDLRGGNVRLFHC